MSKVSVLGASECDSDESSTTEHGYDSEATPANGLEDWFGGSFFTTIDTQEDTAHQQGNST